MNIFIKIKHTFFLSILFSLFLSGSMLSQALSSDFSKMSDEEIYSYWKQAKAQGYTLEQVKAIALARGVSKERIDEMESKLNGNVGAPDLIEGVEIDNSLEIVKDNNRTSGFSGGSEIKETSDPLFGYDFFNNKNITFTPNINLTTPANYQLGPGDELVINIWGAAESVYNRSIDREGAIRIAGIGPVYLNGMTIEEAIRKIRGSLSRIYSGINAEENSPYKVFVGVSLVNVRTVQVNIIGEIKVPGTYSLSALSSVLNALYASGGPTVQGSFRDVKLIRNGVEISSFDIYKYLINGSEEGNKTIQDQDLIIVPPYISRITVKGSIKRPGVYEIKPSENLADLIRYMSGFTSNAYKDRLILERIEGDKKVVKEVLTDNSQNESLKDGDNLFVKSVIDKYVNRISINGAVYRPGNYELTEGLTVKDLIAKASGLLEYAFTDRAILFSTDDGITQTAKPFSVFDVMNDKNVIILKPDDNVKIFSKYGLSENSFLTLGGAVNTPDVFPYIENMTLEDLIILGGGFKDGADTKVVDIYRKVTDDVYETLSESIRVSKVNRSLNIENEGAFILKPNDKVIVRYLIGYTEQVNVEIMGEINYPGQYSMSNKDEKISDLVEKSGGLSPYAFVEGASLKRLNPFYKEVSQSGTLNTLSGQEVDSDVTIDLNNQRSYRVGIDLKDILKNKNSKSNLVLKNGDILEIPSVKQTVKVEGTVLLPSLIRFNDNYTLKDYINKSGGFGAKAKKNKTFVVYSNGDIASTKHFLFFRSFPKLEPGAVILVPSKVEGAQSKLSLQELIGITTGIATLGLLINNLAK